MTISVLLIAFAISLLPVGYLVLRHMAIKAGLKLEIKELKEEILKQQKQFATEVSNTADQYFHIGKDQWAPQFTHTEDKVKLFHAIGLDPKQAEFVKQEAVLLFTEYIRADLKISEVIEAILRNRSNTTVEKLIMFEEFYFLYRLTAISGKQLWDMKTSLQELAKKTNPNHALVKFIKKDQASQKVVTSVEEFNEVVKEVLDSIRPKRKSYNEPEEQLHAKEQNAAGEPAPVQDNDSRVSNL